jgi:flagellar motor protein MotB
MNNKVALLEKRILEIELELKSLYNNETPTPEKKETLEEGWKEVLLGVSLMLGVNLSNQGKALAQDITKNKETMSQIKDVIEDTTKTTELINLMKEKGFKNPSELISKNADNLIKNYNEISDNNNLNYKVNKTSAISLRDLNSKLQQGYAISKIDTRTEKETAGSVKKYTIKDSLEINLNSDNLFKTGSYELSQIGKDSIISIFNEIKAQNGTILKLEIESSTDAERISYGNKKLAELRNALISQNSTFETIKIEKPDNGSNVVSAQEFYNARNNKEELENLRIKTSEFRYSKLKIDVLYISESENSIIIPQEIVTKYRVELIKVCYNSKGVIEMDKGPIFPKKKMSCKTSKDSNKFIHFKFITQKQSNLNLGK